MSAGEDSRSYFVDTSAGRMSVREEGGDGGPCVLLLHGSSFSKEVFDPLMGRPSLGGIRLVAIDFPGHGASEDASDPARVYSVSGFAAVVREVIVSLGLKGCLLVGWSLGGDIAMEFLGREPDVAGVALVGAPPVSAGLPGRLRGYRATGALLAVKGRFSREEALLFEQQCLGEASDGRFVETLQRTDPRMRPSLARAVLLGDGIDQLDAARSTSLPLWLVAGEQDPLLRISYVEQFRSPTLYGRAAWIVAGCGHAPFFERPDAFATRLASFVRDACGDGSRAQPDASGRSSHRRSDTSARQDI